MAIPDVIWSSATMPQALPATGIVGDSCITSGAPAWLREGSFDR